MLHVTREDFIKALETATSVDSLCKILGKSKPSLKRRWVGLIRPDGYYNYTTELNHRVIIEKYLNRKLDRSEHVHHIDGNKINNKLDNLIVVKASVHNSVHASLEKCAFELLKQGFIEFNKDYLKYELKKVK